MKDLTPGGVVPSHRNNNLPEVATPPYILKNTARTRELGRYHALTFYRAHAIIEVVCRCCISTPIAIPRKRTLIGVEMTIVLVIALITALLGWASSTRRLNAIVKEKADKCEQLMEENRQLRHEKSANTTELNDEIRRLTLDLARFNEQHL